MGHCAVKPASIAPPVPNKKSLSERDICTQYITPALQRAGWDFATKVREEVTFTKGRVIVRGKLHTRGKQKRADYVLYYAPNLPIAVIEAKDNNHTVGDGMQQGLNYAETLDVPFAISSNGDAFLIHDRSGQHTPIEQQLADQKDEINKEIAFPLSWESEGGKHKIVVRRQFDDLRSPGNREQIKQWFADVINRYVNTFRPKIERILAET